MEPNLNALETARQRSRPGAAGPSLGEAVGPERRPSGCGSLSLMIIMMITGIDSSPGAADSQPRNHGSSHGGRGPAASTGEAPGPGPSRLRGSG